MIKKHVIITGGNKGIGLETTKLLLDKGFDVTVLARDFSNFRPLENCTCIEFDLREIDKISTLISSLAGVDVLINNAGIMNSVAFNDYPTDKKDELMKINLEAPIELINCVSKGMMERKSGRIINNASLAGQTGHPDVWYGISKAGLINSTKSYARILGGQGIVINAVCAGPAETDMMKQIQEARKDALLKSTYLGRFAEPTEVAEAILWLATDSPNYINGTCIDLNNGSFPR